MGFSVDKKEKIDRFYENIKRYFNLSRDTIGVSDDWVQCIAENIAEMVEVWFMLKDDDECETITYLTGYLDGMDVTNPYVNCNRPEFIHHAMCVCNTFEEFMDWLDKEVNGND